jgi:hypothetical protein
VAKAELAVEHAADSNAMAYAPVELAMAQDKLSAARRAMDRDDNDDARRLANEALVHAQLAEAKADSESARLAAEQTRRSIEALQRDTTVVIEKTQKSAPIVVERSTAPDLVIEKKPAVSQVVIEHQPPTAAVIVQPDEPDVIIESR